MYETNPVKQYFSKSSVKALVAAKIIGAVLMVGIIVLGLASGVIRSMDMIGTTRGGGAMLVGGVILYSIPLLALIGMAILWAVAFTRSKSSDGSILNSAASASLCLSCVGFLAALSITLFVIGAISSASQSVSSPGIQINDKALAIMLLIFSGIGVLALLPTAISRMKFYNRAHLAITAGELPQNGSTFYAVMKFINAVVKVGFAVVIIMLMTKMDGAPASAVITFVCMMLAFLVGAIGNVIEAMIAMKFKKLDAIPQAPYGSPYDSPYAYPSAAPQTQQPYDSPYAAPQTQQPYNSPYAAQPAAPQTTQYCPSCGNPAPAESIFCEKCGQRLK